MSEDIDAWKHKIGDFISSFAAVEHITYQIMFNLLSDDIFDDLKDQGLSKRIDICVKLTRDCECLDQKWRDRFQYNLKRAKGNIQNRNLVAHNPMFMDIYHNSTKDEFNIIPRIMSVKKQEKFILYEDLDQLVVSMADISGQLSACMSALAGVIGQP